MTKRSKYLPLKREDGSLAERLSGEGNIEGSFGTGLLNEVGDHESSPLQDLRQAEACEKGGIAYITPFAEELAEGVFYIIGKYSYDIKTLR